MLTSFYPKITVPTRLSNNHGTLIDNFFCKLTENTLDTTSCVLINKFSDQQPYSILLNNIVTKESPLVYVKVTKQTIKLNNIFTMKFLHLTKSINLKPDVMENPNNTYNILHCNSRCKNPQRHVLKISKM